MLIFSQVKAKAWFKSAKLYLILIFLIKSYIGQSLFRKTENNWIID